jgi:regulator of replication initiation timing
MSYIDNTKGNMMKEIYILELENEMLRNQVIKLKIERNELLDSTKRVETTPNEERKGAIGE